MTKPAETTAPTDEARDLSPEVIAAMDRMPGDLIKCTRVGSDRYRVNWWSARSVQAYDNPSMNGMTYGTHVVRQSRFLKVISTPQGLNIRDAAIVAQREFDAD